MPGRPLCPKCDSKMLLVKVVLVNGAISTHNYECMRCDYVQQTPILEKVMPTGGWVIEAKSGLANGVESTIAAAPNSK
jgi:hypothetical protein